MSLPERITLLLQTVHFCNRNDRVFLTSKIPTICTSRVIFIFLSDKSLKYRNVQLKLDTWQSYPPRYSRSSSTQYNPNYTSHKGDSKIKTGTQHCNDSSIAHDGAETSDVLWEVA